MKTPSVFIPAFNEGGTIHLILHKIIIETCYMVFCSNT